jgi:hypothetical protein
VTKPVTPSAQRKYRLARDVTLPKGNVVVYVSKMKKEVERVALAVISLGEDAHGEFSIYFDDALRLGLIEEVSEPPNL